MKKLNPSVFKGALYGLLFVAAAVYIEVRIKPQVLYYWNPELFLTTLTFFREIALLPGGLTTYADKFLFQLNAIPWVGALLTVSFALLIGVFAKRIYTALTGVPSTFLAIVPLFFLLCTLNQFRIVPLTNLLLALVLADVLIHQPRRKAPIRVAVFFVASCFFVLVVHDLYWLFAALCIISEILRHEDRWIGALYAVLAFAILSVDQGYLYLVHTKVESPGTAMAGAIQRGSIIELAALMGLALLAVGVAYKKKSLSGLALLPLLATGYAELQTWSPSSKALFGVILGAPLFSALLAGRWSSRSIQWPVWTRPAFVTLLSLLGTTTIGLTFNGYWSSVLRLNFYSTTQQWSAILQEVQEPTLADASPILVSPFILEALYHTGKLPDDLFKYRQLYPPYAANVTPETLREDLEHGKYMVNLQQNARVCFELGLINYAELTAYDVLEYRGDLLSSYQLIALVYLLKGNFEASRPFLTIIKQNLLSSAWADRYLAYADDPKRMESDPHLMALKSRILLVDDPVDTLLQRPPFYEVAHRLVAHNPENDMARAYLMSSYLLNGQVTKIYEAFFPSDGSVSPLDTGAMPRACQEASLVYLEATGQNVSSTVAKRMQEATLRDFMEYSAILQRRASGYAVNGGAAPGKFDATYLPYYTSLSNKRRTWANTVDSAH